MKNDAILTSLVSFLLPIILLYGIFALTNLVEDGFFAIIYSVFVAFGAYILYLIGFSKGIDSSQISTLRLIAFSALFTTITYIISVLFLITDSLSI